jgi:hypothetical protein
MDHLQKGVVAEKKQVGRSKNFVQKGSDGPDHADQLHRRLSWQEEEYPWDLDSHMPSYYGLYGPSNREPWADYLANITPVRVESTAIHAPMRVVTIHPKRIKDFPNGPLAISCIGLSGMTIGEFDCHWNCKFSAIRALLAQQLEMEEHRVRLISAQGMKLLDNMLINSLVCGNFVEQNDDQEDDDVEDALIRSRLELKHSI